MTPEEQPFHTVAVDALVINERNEVLMIDSPKRGWEFPGGKVESGETLQAGLLREVLEETGIEVAMGRLLGVYQNVRTNLVVLAFECKYVSGQPATSDESLAVEWVPRAEALARIKVPFIRERLRDMLEFNGETIYRAYRLERGAPQDTYMQIEEALI